MQLGVEHQRGPLDQCSPTRAGPSDHATIPACQSPAPALTAKTHRFHVTGSGQIGRQLELDQRFDAGEDISEVVDWDSAQRINHEPGRVNVDFWQWNALSGASERCRDETAHGSRVTHVTHGPEIPGGVFTL